MTKAEMLARISSAELAEWMAYEQVTGPLGPERGDMLHGIHTAVVANSNRGRRGRRAKAADFIPRWDAVKRVMGWEEMLAAVRGIHTALGGTDTSRDGGGDGNPGRAARGDRDGHQRPHGRRGRSR